MHISAIIKATYLIEATVAAGTTTYGSAGLIFSLSEPESSVILVLAGVAGLGHSVRGYLREITKAN